MPLDSALVGSAMASVFALISQAISKCKCRIACARDEDGIVQSPSCVCGFLDAPLFESNVVDKDEGESTGGELHPT